MEKLKEKVFSSLQVEDEELQNLLKHRKDGKFDFKLIDIREIYEYSNSSIDETDLLFPTTMLHEYMDHLDELKDKYIVLYCRTGSRTSQVLNILKRMGFEKVAHLTSGIIAFSGETSKNAKLPNNIKI